MRPHIVRQGEHLAGIAHAAGVSPDSLWDDPSNKDVRGARPNPDTLLPGDVIFVPEPKRRLLPLETGAKNRYVAGVPKIDVALVFRDDEGPLADEPYVVEGLGEPLEGRSDAEGKVSFQAFIHLRSVTVSLPLHAMSYEVRVGDMDPVEEPSGVLARLENLGYHAVARGRKKLDQEDALRAAVRRFQRDRGLTPTGEIDRALRDALIAAHGT